jgi:holo-[acyl-carrier protein] synthase
LIVAVGLDVVDLKRVARVYHAHGERFLARCFTPSEQALARSRRDPIPALAARFAAKEAFQKVYPETLHWCDVGVVVDDRGAPSLAFSAKVEARMRQQAWRAHVSLTHAREHAAAVVVLETLPA